LNLEYTGAWHESWAWATPLIVLTVIVHVNGLGQMFDRVIGVHHRSNRRFTGMLVLSATVLTATLLHALEGGIWALSYVLLGALPDPKTAMLYSLNAMTSYGHVSTELAEHWQMMGALEALNGMILFGLTTAFLFKTIEHVRPTGSRPGR
jgi:hypothetical protein